MKYSLTLFFVFYLFLCHACPQDSVGIVKKKELYSLNGQCEDSILWEEIHINNAAIQNKINSDIYATIQRFKLDSLYFESICNGDILDEAYSKIVYSQNNIVSIFFEQHIIYPNQKSPTFIRTVNYSLKTGDTITFQELFKPAKQHYIDSIIIAEVKLWYAEFEMNFGVDELANTQEQIKHAQFNIEDTRIVLYLIGTHCGYCTDEDPAVVFDFNEYKNCFNKKGVLKTLLDR